MNPPDSDQEPYNAHLYHKEEERQPEQQQLNPFKTSPALSFLRIVIWLLPSIIILVLFLFLSIEIFFNSIQVRFLEEFLIFFSFLGATIAMGYFDERIAARQQQIESARIKRGIKTRIGMFILCQIFIVPIILGTLLYGFCLMIWY